MDLKSSVAIVAGGFIFSVISLKCIASYKKGFITLKPTEIKFVRNTNLKCKGHVFNKTICAEYRNDTDPTFECSYSILLWMVNFFDSTNNTLDISIYLVTCEAFRDAILRAFNRGVKVRIFADFIMAKGSGSAVPIFIQAGIPLRMMEQSRMMHRKSAISDNNRLLMGTGNWTMQALAGNWDMWYQTSDPLVVSRFASEFEEQWTMSNLMQPTYSEFSMLSVYK